MKKKAAIAMSLMTVAGSVVPAFANETGTEIVGKPQTKFNLDLLKSDDPEEKVKAEKDLEATKKQIEELVAQKDSNGNNVYEVEYTKEVKNKNIEGKTETTKDGKQVKFLHQTVTFKRIDDITGNHKDIKYLFVNKVVDFGFGQQIEALTKNVNVNTAQGKTNLAGYLYEIDAAGSKVYTNLEEIKEAKAQKAEDAKVTIEVRLAEVPEGEEEGILIGKINVTGALFDKKGEFLINEVSANNDFRGHWAEEQIVLAMIEEKVDNSTKFRPNDDITRAEFAKIACTAFGINPTEYAVDEKDDYSDVNRYEWYAKYVKALTDAKVVSGDGNGTFRPTDKITREEAAVIIATLNNTSKDEKGKTVYNKKDTVTTDVNGNRVHKDIVTDFSDDAKISNWADESVQFLKTKGITNGYEVSDEIANEFRPANNISRAESLVMLTRKAK